MMDKYGNKHSASQIAQIKVVAPNMACDVIDRAIQMHGGGVSQDFPWLKCILSCDAQDLLMVLMKFAEEVSHD